jgi:serine protease Do
MEHQMHKLIFLVFAIVAAVCPGAPVFARSIEPGDAAAVERATPAVVCIHTWQVIAPDQPGGSSQLIKVYGSGFVVDPSGIIVTNKHVVDGAIDIKALFSDGSLVSAHLLAASSLVDLAVLKVDVDHKLTSLEWGDSGALQVGDPVLTIGNELNWGTSVSAGIVSGLNRNLMDSAFDSYIQTDATINHGNSGGPLIDPEGKVVGIATALYNPQGEGFIGIGFAIPASTAQYVTAKLVDPNMTEPGWLGFKLQDMTWSLATALGVPYRAGAIVASVESSGPADQASLQPGDVLTKFNGHSLTDSRAFMRAIAESPIARPVHLTMFREDKEHEVNATVAAWPNLTPHGGAMPGQTTSAMEPNPGVTLAPITEADRKLYGLSPALTGALITQVRPNSEAGYRGVVPGDVIVAVERTPVATPNDVHKAIKEAYAQDRPYLAMLIQTKTGAQWVSISISTSKS